MSKIWAISCGNTSANQWKSMWPEWQQQNHATIGSFCTFNLVVDNVPLTTEVITRNILISDSANKNGVNERKALAQARIAEKFAFDIFTGDYIVARVGLSKVFGIGEVVGPIEYSESAFEPKTHHQLRRINWLKVFSKAIVLQNRFHLQSTIEDLHMSFTKKPDGKLNLTYQQYKGSVPSEKSVKLVQEILTRCELPYC